MAAKDLKNKALMQKRNKDKKGIDFLSNLAKQFNVEGIKFYVCKVCLTQTPENPEFRELDVCSEKCLKLSLLK